MAVTQVRMPRLMLTGCGAFAEAPAEVGRLGRRALVVTDPVMVKVGHVGRLVAGLEAAGVAVVIFDGVTGEPTDEMVAAGLAALRSHRADVVVAVGGGSPIDTAKGIAAMATNPGAIVDYMGFEKFVHKPLPLVAIPTTAGTGSEVTRFTIITDHARDVKMLIASAAVLPDVAVVDPELTVSSPRPVTAATGIDALTHAIEAYVSRKAQPFTDVLALSAMRRLAPNLKPAWANGGDLAARTENMLGATEAGIAFSNASVALVHGMSRPIGAVFHIAHGVSNAMLLPLVMEWSLPAAVDRYADVAAAMGCDVRGLSREAAARTGIAFVRRLCRDLEIPNMKAAGVDRDVLARRVEKMAHDALVSGSPGNNPRVPTAAEIVELYWQAYEYEF